MANQRVGFMRSDPKMPQARFSTVRFLLGVTSAILALIGCDRWFGNELVLVRASRLLVVLVTLPIAIMVSPIAMMFAFGILTSPIVVAILIAALSSWLQVPWPVIAGFVVVVIVGWTVFESYRPTTGPAFFQIYEFGADRIVPYYRWLFSPQRAPVFGIITGMAIWVATN